MSNIVHILQQHKEVLFKKYPLKSMAIFGSYSRGEETMDSDVDVMVELNGPIGIRFLDLNYEIEKLLHKKVDLVSKRGIKPGYLAFIEPDLIYV
jgi:predicted nucleotidyltransferase